MSIKIGNTAINKIYVGADEIKKVYIGTNLILDNGTIDTVVTIDTTSTSSGWTPTSIVNSGATLTWEVTGDVTPIAPQVIDKPILNLLSNTGTAVITITSSTSFVGLTEMWFNNGAASLEITSIDISEATELTKIDMFTNDLTTIDLSQNTALIYPWIQSNSLTTIDVSTNTLATFIAVDNNALTALDISSNTILTDLWANDNALTTAELDAIINDLDTNGQSNGEVRLAGNVGLPLTAASGTAYDALVGKGWTIDVAKYTPVDIIDPIIGTLAYANETDTTVELTCAATDNIAVTEFKIYLDTFLDRTVTGSGLVDYEFDGLTADTNYDIYVVAYDAAGNFSDNSNTINFTTDAAVTSDGLYPVISNFRVENAHLDRVYFDSSEIITSSTGVNGYTGFTITDKVISQITINTGLLIDHYFTVTVDFDHYSNNTIRYSTGSDLADADIGALYPFDLQYITNNIVEPSTNATKFVAVGASGGGDSIGDPMVWSDAQSVAAGTKVNWAKGDYGAINFVQSTEGTLALPIVHEGYDTTPGDSPSLTFAVDLAFDANVMPYINSVSSSGSGFSLGGQDYIIVKNIQVKGYAYTINFGGQSNYCVLDNVYAMDSSIYTIMGFFTSMVQCRVINSFIGNSVAHGIRMAGNRNRIEDCYVSSNGTPDMDYYVSIYAAASGLGENIVRGLTIIRDPLDTHTGHGISLRQGGVGRAIQNTLVENCYVEAVGSAALELRSEGVEYCVMRNIEVNNLNLTSGTFNAMRITSAQNNIIDGLVAYDCEIFIRFYASDEEQSSIDALDSGNNNLFKNCVFYNNLTANDNWAIVSYEDKTYPTTSRVPNNNTFANCTFHHIDTSVQNPNGTQGVGNEFINCIFNDVDNRSDNWEYTYSNFYTTFPTPSGAGNVSTKPNFTAVDDGGFDLTTNTPSQVYNGGTDVGVYYDAKGQERKTSYSMGAYEWNEGDPFVTKQYSESIYAESILLPVYDSGDASHKLISVQADWNDINSGTYKHFFVEVGDYRSSLGGNQQITLTASGTASDKRTIQLYNGNDLHPAMMTADSSTLAMVGFRIEGDYWIIDRMATWDMTPTALLSVEIWGGSHNIINRYWNINSAGAVCYLYADSHYNTVQNCRWERDEFVHYSERAAFGMSNNGVANVDIIGNKFIQNESVNAIDAFQIIRSGTADQVNFNCEGTIIDCNHFYIDSTIYTDGAGNHDANGNYALAENAMDLKSGSYNDVNPVIITNNYMAGFRTSDISIPSLEDAGNTMIIHREAFNVNIIDNLVHDTQRGISTSNPFDTYSAENITIEDNILKGVREYCLSMNKINNFTVQRNLFKDITSLGSSWNFIMDDALSSIFSYNQIISPSSTSSCTQYINGSIVTRVDNTYFDVNDTRFADDASDIEPGTDPTINYNDVNLITDRFTNSPQTITITKVAK